MRRGEGTHATLLLTKDMNNNLKSKLPQLPPQFKPDHFRELPYKQVERYPLGDYLYNRSKAQHDLIRAEYNMRRLIMDLPEHERDMIEKIARLGRKKRLTQPG